MASPFKNFGVKLAALLLATLLWFHVATEKTIQYEISLPLQQIDLAGDLVLTEPPEEDINIMVSATGKRLLQSAWKKSGLKLTVSRNVTGRFKTELSTGNVSMVKSDGVDLVEILSPREITLNCDRLMETEVPVKSNITIVPDDGFVLNQINSLMPQKVTISGPRRHIMAIDSIETVKENYAGIRNDLKLKIPLVYPDYYNVTIIPDTVLYLVGVAPIKSRIFENIPIRAVNQPSDSMFEWEPKMVEVRMGGQAEFIDSITSDSITAKVDFSRPDSRGNYPITISHSKELTVLDQNPQEVRIITQQ